MILVFVLIKTIAICRCGQCNDRRGLERRIDPLIMCKKKKRKILDSEEESKDDVAGWWPGNCKSLHSYYC